MTDATKNEATPGPWRHNGEIVWSDFGEGEVVASLDSANAANAALIALAPDMAVLLREFGDYLCRRQVGHDGDEVPPDWREHTCGECETCRARSLLNSLDKP